MIRGHHDNYQGWIDKKQLEPVDEVPPIKGMIDLAAVVLSPQILPAGAYLRSKDSSVNSDHQKRTITESAMLFHHCPYLWGGRTAFGIDCSGLTQLSARLAGISISRDASQQVEHGEAITFVGEAANGDLAFFDNAEGRIIHVGIILRDVKKPDDLEIIHASGKVRIDRLDHQGIFNKEIGKYTHNLRMIRRIVK